MKEKRKIHPALLALVLPALIGLVSIIFVARAAELKRAEDLIESYTKNIANGISSFFTDATAVASAASSLHSAQELNWEVAGMDFTGFIRSNHFIHRISLVDTDGYIYDAYETGPFGNPWQGGRRTENDADPASPPILVTDREYYRVLVAENSRAEFSVMVNEPFVPTGLTEKVFVTSAPIISGGRAVGTVSVAQTALELSSLYENLTMDFFDKFESKAHLYLVSYGEQLISDLEYNESYGVYMDRLFGSAEIVPVSILGNETFSAIDAVVREERRVINAALHGESHFIAGVKIPDTPFAVCLAVLKSQMLYASRYIIIISITAFLLTVLGVGIAFFTLSRDKPSPPEGGEKPRFKPRRLDGEILSPPVLPLDQR